MGVKKQAKRLAAGAGVALATSGLSTCGNCGGTVVDPVPPPLQCNVLSGGQSLVVNGSRSGDTVTVAVQPGTLQGMSFTWKVDSVSDVAGATLRDVHLPGGQLPDSLKLKLVFGSGSTQAAFTVNGTLYGFGASSCTLRRTFQVTLAAGGGVLISSGDLPLAARDSVRIALVSQQDRVVELAAQTDFPGTREFSWRVSDGDLDRPTGSTVRWTLPAAPGIYQAELVVDYGLAGLAVDQLLLEVG